MKHTKQACDIVRSFVDRTRNKGEYPDGLDYKVYVVIAAYILGNEKDLISTDLPDGRYFEVTYDADRDAFYLDCYVRIHNEVIGGGMDG